MIIELKLFFKIIKKIGVMDKSVEHCMQFKLALQIFTCFLNVPDI